MTDDDSGSSTEPRTTTSHWRSQITIFAVAAIVIGALLYLGRPEQLCACSPTAPPLPASPVEGLVVNVTSAGLGQVERFNLRLASGDTIVLQMGDLENATEFPPGHLAEHQATSQPIRAWYRVGTSSGDPEVYRLEDASG